MSYNPFDQLDLGSIFLQLPVLKEFYAVSCQVNHSSLTTLSKLIDHHHHYLELIDLSSNNLTSLCNHLFDGLFNLKELRLNNNNIYLVDNYFIRSLNFLKTLNLASNAIEYLPNLFSSSLEYLNLSSNNIQSLNDYFASHLRSIRLIDFDSNTGLHTISSRSFCFINIVTLEKLSFRSTDLPSLDTFQELLCRLAENNQSESLLDINHNINLKCHCMLIQFEKLLLNYRDLTCVQQGQDRYYISKLTNTFANCSWDYCAQQATGEICDSMDAEQVTSEGACQALIVDNDNQTSNHTQLIVASTIISRFDDYDNGSNFTIGGNATGSKAPSLARARIAYLCLCVLWLVVK